MGSKRPEFNPILLFPDHNSCLKSSILIQCYGKLLIILSKCPIDFDGHRSKVKVKRGQNVSNFAQF